jgi:4-amino-4-deoxy-L-arabinose transferase-like glycosyltransferase
MPMDSLGAALRARGRRAWPELLVGLMAAASFLSCLGSVEVWGKREQRASAEALDTVGHGRWLVAEIQGHPRLEKPPLPRWMIAALMGATGRRDEWIVRLPGALCGLATVALIYAMGRRMGGREVGLASAMILGSSGFFLGELRQAGNDGPLALFTTMALFAAWRLVELPSPADPASRRGWRWMFIVALGLGFLSKGPIVLLLTATAIVPYLVQARRLGPGLRQLVDAPGLLLFVAMAASWPAAVAWREPGAVALWLMEMTEKVGVLGTLVHRRHALLVGDWPVMMFPWSIVAMASLILPFFRRGGDRVAAERHPGESRRSEGPSPCWYAWWWAAGNMAIFCLWAVAKTTYYLPCIPGVALLAGQGWVRLARHARSKRPESAGLAARVMLQAQWVLIFVAALAGPVATRPWIAASYRDWTLAAAGALAVSVVLSVLAWRRGADAMSLAPIAAAWGFGVVVTYGILAPVENPRRGHRELALAIRRIVPQAEKRIHFFNEVDEGLWFYLEGLRLEPVPGTSPHYSTAYDLALAYRSQEGATESLEQLDNRRETMEKQALLRWLDRRGASTRYLLIRSRLLDRYARELAGRATPVLRESGLSRNELVLLRADGRAALADGDAAVRR